MLSPRQTIATWQRNISQHCWAQHVECVWPPCCDMLGVVGSNLAIFKLEPTTPNMSQQIATRWPNASNMLRPTVLSYVTFKCCDRLAGALGRVPLFNFRQSEDYSEQSKPYFEPLTFAWQRCVLQREYFDFVCLYFQ